MTDEELDALVRDAVLAADCMQETGTFETGQGILHDCARAITTLRAQLAEALEWKRYWSGEMAVVLAGRADETDRADRAEAALEKSMKTLEFYSFGHITPPSWQYAQKTIAELKDGCK